MTDFDIKAHVREEREAIMLLLRSGRGSGLQPEAIAKLLVLDIGKTYMALGTLIDEESIRSLPGLTYEVTS